MAHIQIAYGTPADGHPAARVLVDGVDITDAVLADGFGVEFEHDTRRAVVSMKLRADRLDLELPDSIIDALAGDRSTTSEED